MGMIEIEYEPNKIKVFTKIDEEPISARFYSSVNPFGDICQFT